MSYWWEKECLIQFVAPTSIIIGGPSNCGKTYLVKNILQNSKGMFTKSVSHIIHCYGSPWQPLFDELQEVLKEKITFQEGIPAEQVLLKFSNHGKHFLCVLDDLCLILLIVNL